MSRAEVRRVYGDRVVAELDFIVQTLDELELIVDAGKDELLTNVLQQRAVEGCANRIGDTIRNKIPIAIQEQYRGCKYWSAWIGWRVLLSHRYHIIDVDLLWNDVSGNDIPEFRRLLTAEILSD
jgi:uncharacterized protein with HEPN domain